VFNIGFPQAILDGFSAGKSMIWDKGELLWCNLFVVSFLGVIKGGRGSCLGGVAPCPPLFKGENDHIKADRRILCKNGGFCHDVF
jgi:hypothetical protein